MCDAHRSLSPLTRHFGRHAKGTIMLCRLTLSFCLVLLVACSGGGRGGGGGGGDDAGGGGPGADAGPSGTTMCGAFVCEAGQHCQNFACVSGCLTLQNCPTNHTCENPGISGVCVQSSTPQQDAGQTNNVDCVAFCDKAIECGVGASSARDTCLANCSSGQVTTGCASCFSSTSCANIASCAGACGSSGGGGGGGGGGDSPSAACTQLCNYRLACGDIEASELTDCQDSCRGEGTANCGVCIAGTACEDVELECANDCGFL